MKVVCVKLDGLLSTLWTRIANMELCTPAAPAANTPDARFRESGRCSLHFKIPPSARYSPCNSRINSTLFSEWKAQNALPRR